MARTLILSPPFTPDSMALRSAAIELGWDVERLRTWRPPEELAGVAWELGQIFLYPVYRRHKELIPEEQKNEILSSQTRLTKSRALSLIG